MAIEKPSLGKLKKAMFLPKRMPGVIIIVAIIGVLASWLPLALIARARVVKKSQPRVHFFQDMDNQPRFNAQSTTSVFSDTRAMRPRVEGTVPREPMGGDPAVVRGMVGDQFVSTIPPAIEVDQVLLDVGQKRFNQYCATCHGEAGYGDGPVNQRGVELSDQDIQANPWVACVSLHTTSARQMPDGQLYDTITHGVVRSGQRRMAPYGPLLTVRDRWAVVAYVRALQQSQNAKPQQLTPEQRRRLMESP